MIPADFQKRALLMLHVSIPPANRGSCCSADGQSIANLKQVAQGPTTVQGCGCGELTAPLGLSQTLTTVRGGHICHAAGPAPAQAFSLPSDAQGVVAGVSPTPGFLAPGGKDKQALTAVCYRKKKKRERERKKKKKAFFIESSTYKPNKNPTILGCGTLRSSKQTNPL